MKKKVSLFTLFLCCIVASAITFTVQKLFNKPPDSIQPVVVSECSSSMDQIRIKRYKFIQPLLLTDVNSESYTLQPIRNKIDHYVTGVKNAKKAEDVSVYFRRLNNGAWFSINPGKSYNPASMSKIIYLITYLKEAENNPSIIQKKLYFSHHYDVNYKQDQNAFSMKENEYYTVNDLLNYMIKYSDNDATILLGEHINTSVYNQIFNDLYIPPAPTNGEYFISVYDFSKFFRILYSSTYLRPDYSEFGLTLLASTTFMDGLKQGVDSTVEMAHKFGVRILGDKAELHEFGIVFVKGDPYLIGVMTSGSSIPQLSEIIGEISRIAYSDYISLFHNQPNN
jgi:beta-lactamase class A